VKLLLDENLSRRIVSALQERFPGTTQVGLLGLERSTDAQLCDYASQHDYVLVSKDDDFQALVAARAYRPKLIRLAMGNATNAEVLATLLSAADRLDESLSMPDVGVVVIEVVREQYPGL
jgi:predicted nuclease of predicted toxin-antitoxin system